MGASRKRIPPPPAVWMGRKSVTPGLLGAPCLAPEEPAEAGTEAEAATGEIPTGI